MYSNISHSITPHKRLILTEARKPHRSEETLQREWELMMGRYGYKKRNERGERLAEFALKNDMYSIASTQDALSCTHRLNETESFEITVYGIVSL